MGPLPGPALEAAAPLNLTANSLTAYHSSHHLVAGGGNGGTVPLGQQEVETFEPLLVFQAVGPAQDKARHRRPKKEEAEPEPASERTSETMSKKEKTGRFLHFPPTWEQILEAAAAAEVGRAETEE